MHVRAGAGGLCGGGFFLRDGAFILIAASAFCVRARAGFGDINVGLRCAKPTYNNGGHNNNGGQSHINPSLHYPPPTRPALLRKPAA